MKLANENKQDVLKRLEDKGLLSLKKHIENIIKINEEDYKEGSEYGTDKGYGFAIFVMNDIEDYVSVRKEFNLERCEIEEDIEEGNGLPSSHYLLYLTGSDSGVVIYITDMI